MHYKYLLLVALVLMMAILLSGCCFTDNQVNKPELTKIYINNVMNKTIPIWNSTHNNSTIITSSAYIINARQVNGRVQSTILFNTSDGTIHSINVSDYQNGTQLLDIDGMPHVQSIL